MRRDALTKVILLAASIGLSGCFPLPLNEIHEGKKIDEQDLAWLVAGETTRAQVLARLGAPDVDFVDRRAIVYAWAGDSTAIVIGYGGTTIKMRRALLIRFDAGDRVAAFSVVERPKRAIPYDALDPSPEARSSGWRAILEQWLAQAGRNHDGQAR